MVPLPGSWRGGLVYKTVLQGNVVETSVCLFQLVGFPWHVWKHKLRHSWLVTGSKKGTSARNTICPQYFQHAEESSQADLYCGSVCSEQFQLHQPTPTRWPWEESWASQVEQPQAFSPPLSERGERSTGQRGWAACHTGTCSQGLHVAFDTGCSGHHLIAPERAAG